MSLKSEIFEQPAVLAHLIKEQTQEVRKIAHTLQKKSIKYIFLAARGTSDNAGLYAKYLLGAFNRLPTALAAPSLFSLYRKPPDMSHALVVGISQSGRSPDIVSVMTEAKRQKVPSLAISNDPHSPLAQAAEFSLDIHAGPEKAIAATKTYTLELLAIGMLSAALQEDKKRFEELQHVPSFVQKVLEMDSVIKSAAERFRFMEKCVVLGRGFNYATAYEWSLKLKELAYVSASPYSSADFQHGPVAIISKGFPVLAVAPDGAVFENMMNFLTNLVHKHQVKLLAVSNRQEAISMAQTPLALPKDLPEWLSPLVSIVPAQLFCYHLTRVKGLDPDNPRGLNKITLTY